VRGYRGSVTAIARVGRLLAPVAEAADAVVGALPGTPRRQRTSVRVTAHRPWPLPADPWIMGQTWTNLLFAHWPVRAAALRGAVPAELELDLFDSRAWITVTPFDVRGTRARGAPPPPKVSHFAELNVRTYVTVADRPGIYFFSLDAASSLAVVAARMLYRLPYFRAAMHISEEDGSINYTSERTDTHGAPARFAACYAAIGPAAPAAPGTLDAWLVDRVQAIALDERRRVLAADIHHRPWPIRPATADIRINTMAEPIGIELAEPAVLHFAQRQDVVFWALDTVPVGGPPTPIVAG
jgi:uncharacterized protein YqjF (DUF2071 family)